MQRKKFIRLTALAATAGIAAGGGYVFFEDFESLARKIILKDTASLKIDPQEFDKFFKDMKKYRKWDALFPPSHRQLIKWHYYIDNPLFSLPYATSYETNRGKIVGTFLLSTDFFLNKMDSSKPLRYRALFDPYLYPCSNPFSNLYYPALQDK